MRYFVGFLVTLGLIILIIFLLFHGGGSKPKVPITSKTLDSYATTSAQVSMTIDGPVNAVSLHQGLRITVDRDNVTYEELTGYDDEVVNMQRFPNTESAYTVFLLALAHAGFTHGVISKTLADERGYCASGDRIIFELNQDGNQLERFWSSTCGKPSTYLGAVGVTQTLFKAQVPNYSAMSQKVKL